MPSTASVGSGKGLIEESQIIFFIVEDVSDMFTFQTFQMYLYPVCKQSHSYKEQESRSGLNK